MDKKTPWFLHVDLDAFFASVEQLDHPEYKGKPVIVGGKPEDKRSVVSTASYEARKFGVHSAMPTYQAYKLCPQGIYVYGRMQRYAELSYQIMTIFKDYSPDVLQMSIDEAFIDITGTEKLFGPPEETAMKIKARVKRDTGLTVSIGLATTKYLAKIASGFSKPDGFYFIKPGTEQQFMLDLPLNKVWGVGEKTLERLKTSGIQSTRDIYERTFDSLEFMFGNNTANFLYNVVRGIDVVGFGHEAKKHSISAENTFSYDIKDVYTAETQLLNLCHGVVFRLIRENCYSRTAYLKIRYDDFSTVSIQETMDRSILTVDSFFEIIKTLFERKYEPGRGIRLLGVGFDNVEKEDRPYQQDLFDSGNEKKQAVEKAILNLEKKHPEVKVQKARMLHNKTKVLALFLLSSLVIKAPVKLQAQTTTKEITGAGPLSTETAIPQDSESLFNWQISDTNNVELLFSGFWKMNLATGLNSSFGNGTGFNSSFSLPVFTQEIDLSTWILLNNKWYFQADFADNFEKNTLAMGYQGNSYLKSARISNRGITMPLSYSANYFGYGLGGGSNQAPGLSLHFEDPFSQKWYGDFLLRYDMTKANSATFYGKNSITDLKISPADFVYGKEFIFPEQAAGELPLIKAVYVESKTGTLRDKSGKKYKQLSSADYLILPGSSKLVLNTSAQGNKQEYKIPTILVTFADKTSIDKIITATGSYKNPDSFAGKIQEYFSTYNNNISLEDFSYNPTTEIESESALIIQNSVMFSPYLSANLYDCGILNTAELFVSSVSTDKQSNEYFAQQLENDIGNLKDDFFYENHLFAQIVNLNSSNNSSQSPSVRYPFADLYPQIYLNLPTQTDLQIVARSYSEVSDFQIGTNAIPGTVQVYINNQLDTGAKYNEETGVVDISQFVNTTDKIFITWQEDSSNFASGALAAGTGLFINITPHLSVDAAITTRWPLIKFENYSTVDSRITGFAAISGGVRYKTEKLTLEQKTAVSVNSHDATGNLLVLQHQESAPQTYYLSNNDGYISKTPPQLPISENLNLELQKNYTIPAHGGISDSKITGYKIPLQWDFSTADFLSQPWAAVDIKLEAGYELNSASNLEIGMLAEIPQEAVPFYEVYLQLGVNATEDSESLSYQNLPTWKLTDINNPSIISPLDLSNSQWQTVIIALSDMDRAKLISNYDAKLIVIPKANFSSENKLGKIFFGPYEPKKQSIFTKANQNIEVQTFAEKAMETPSAKSLLIANSYATKLSWNNSSSQTFGADSKIAATSYFTQADFSSYSSINFDFDTTSIGQVTLSLSDESTKALELSIFDFSRIITPFSSEPNFHKLTINLNTNEVFVDGLKLLPEEYNLQLNKAVIPNLFTLEIDTKKDEVIIPTGTFYIGNLYYSDASTSFGADNYFLAKYSSNENLVTIRDYVLISKPELILSSTQDLSGISSQNKASNISGNAAAGITFADVRYKADFSTQKNAGHSIETENKLLNFLTFGESYRFNNADQSLNKVDKLCFDITNPIIPVMLNFETTAKDVYQNRTQTSKGNALIKAKINNSTLGFETNAEVNQKIIVPQKDFDTQNYFKGWYDISTLQFSTGYEEANNRSETLNSKLYLELPYFSLKPELQYQVKAQYQNLSESLLADTTTLAFIQPFVINNNGFTFNIKRIGGGTTLTTIGGSYISDAQVFSKSFTQRNWLYTSIPFYDLFDTELPNKILHSTPATETADYAGIYEFNWRRKLLNSYIDLLIPSAATMAFSRELKASSVTSDLYQLKLVVSNTALNCFGSQSITKLFNWYEQDEILGNLTFVIKMPQNSELKPMFTITAYEQVLFYVSTNNTLKTGLDLAFDSELNWNTKTTIIWSRPGKTSIISDLIKERMTDKDSVEIKIQRKEIFNTSVGQTEKKLKQKYDFTHSTDFNFLQYYTLSTGVGVTVISTQNVATNAGLTLSIGGKIEF